MRRINAPGIEINEIDRSAYSQITDESLTDTATLVMGFADKGQDYKTNFINNVNTFNLLYGTPTTEAERYFYYASKEVLDNRGVLYCAKLPYYNDSKDKYSYTTYTIDNKINLLSTPYESMIESLPYIDAYDVDIKITEKLNYSDNSFFDVFILKKLPLDYLKIIDNYLSSINGSYKFIDDLVDYVYNQTNLAIAYKDSYQYFFKNIFAIYRLRKLLSEDGLNWIEEQFKKSKDYNQISEIDITLSDEKENLEEIRELLLKYYKNGIDQILFEFGNSRQISDFKNYYDSLSSFIDPLIENDTLKAAGETNENSENHSAHYFKLDYKNLQYFTSLDFYIKNEDQLSNDYTPENWNKFAYRHGDIKSIDNTITSYLEIKSIPTSTRSSGLMSIEDLDRFKIYQKRPNNNTFQIVDISKTRYGKTSDQDIECVGLLPVITTAANAIYFKELDKNDDTAAAFNVIQKIQTVFNRKINNSILSSDEYYDKNEKTYLFDQNLSCTIDKAGYSDAAISFFPNIKYTSTQRIDKSYLKQIGVVVFKMRRSSEAGSRIQLAPVESFVGSLDRSNNNFIDNVINDSSNYINFFSNFQFNKNTPLTESSLFLINNQTATSLGFYEHQTLKTIKVKDSIIDPITRIFDSNKNIDEINLDLILDAGVSTIAQFIESTSQSDNGIGEYDIIDLENQNFSIPSTSNNKLLTNVWKQIADLYDNFCKVTRKDCMFLMDALRATCLEANEKIIRPTNLKNTIYNQIIPKIKLQSSLNTSYGAGYCNWIQIYDIYSGLYFWLPPSIKTAGRIIYNDIYFNYWDPPAGFNYGTINSVIDISFNPTIDEAGKIYNMSWNYIVNYPMEGAIIEGQRTFQIEKTAFDRINVRRLFLKLEKTVYKVSKRFVYEGNTEFTRQRFVDAITPMFEEAKNGGGINDYIIICNEKNNTIDTIENNELHCTIAVRPVKSIEFIILNFIALPQSGSFSEEQLLEVSSNRYRN